MIQQSIKKEKFLNLNSAYLEHEVNASLVYLRASVQAMQAGKSDWSAQLIEGVEKHLKEVAQYLKTEKLNEKKAYLRPLDYLGSKVD